MAAPRRTALRGVFSGARPEHQELTGHRGQTAGGSVPSTLSMHPVPGNGHLSAQLSPGACHSRIPRCRDQEEGGRPFLGHLRGPRHLHSSRSHLRRRSRGEPNHRARLRKNPHPTQDNKSAKSAGTPREDPAGEPPPPGSGRHPKESNIQPEHPRITKYPKSEAGKMFCDQTSPVGPSRISNIRVSRYKNDPSKTGIENSILKAPSPSHQSTPRGA